MTPLCGGRREAMTKQKLPIGVQTFQKVLEDDCYYVGKPLTSRGCGRRLAPPRP